jgi:hypothetical protein
MDSRFDVADLQQAALVINTADYCQTTALEVSSPQLYETFIEHCPDVARGEHQREDPGRL